MKKLVFAVALVMGLGTTVVFAESNLASEVVVMAQVNDFTPIEVKDLPQAVQDALAKNFKDYTVQKAAVEVSEEGAKTYQVTLLNPDGEESVVLFAETGEVLE